MTLQRLFVLGLIVLFSSCLCQKNPVASFVGRLSINGLIADEESDSSRSFVSAPNMAHQNWSSSMSVSQGTITKRAGEPVPRRYGPVWDAAAGNCVFCPEQKLLELDAQTLLRRLTVNKMKTYMRGTAANLNNKCVFYSRGEDRIGTLSSPATFWACMNDKYSIWHLWPNKRMASQDEKINDFYGIYEEGNWLNGIANLPRPIYGAAPATQYFQRMSQAMAESCSGEVIILTERPDTFHDTYSTRLNTANEYMNIWADKERPALRNLRARGVVTNMYLIDIRDYFGTGSDQESVTVYDYDIVTDRTTGISNRVFRRGLLMDRDVLMNDTELAKTDEQHALRKRACTYDDGLESEISGYDYFAGWYDSDYPV